MHTSKDIERQIQDLLRSHSAEFRPFCLGITASNTPFKVMHSVIMDIKALHTFKDIFFKAMHSVIMHSIYDQAVPSRT